jgi:tripartite-type tricarboxylate transporter receptor subunit TctC
MEDVMDRLVRTNRREVLAGMAAAAASSTLCSTSARAAYPDRYVTLIVPFAPGGASDVVARVLSAALPPVLGQSVVVENRSGGNSNVGINAVIRAEPDGYTLLVIPNTAAINPVLYERPPFDPFKDLAPIVELGTAPNLVVVLPTSGITSLADLVKQAKADPGKFSCAASGFGTVLHLAAELLKLRTGISLNLIPYPGTGPGFQALLSGSVHLNIVSAAGFLPYVKAGTVRALVQTGATRSPDLPDVPTMEEAGYPDSVTESFQAVMGPVGTPKAVIDRLERDIVKVLKQPDIVAKMREIGFVVTAGGPDVLRARIERELPMWKNVIEQAGVKRL